jgi:spore coat polysaccharide biosynthesis protein SpsF
MTTVVIVQARMGSTRLPGKVLLPLAGEPLLRRMLERVLAASTPTAVIVAATTDPGDDPIVALCHVLGVSCFRGHPTDLLDRHVRAAREARADAVVKIPSDCPLIDPAVIDRVIGAFHAAAGAADFVSNLHPPSYPDGNDVEVMSMDALETAWREAGRTLEREHTTPFLWERPDRFRLLNVAWETGLDYSMSHRWTIDYPEDYAFLRAVYDALWTPGRPVFTLGEILAFLREHPEVAALNARLAGVNWYRHHLHELTTITPDQTRKIHG